MLVEASRRIGCLLKSLPLIHSKFSLKLINNLTKNDVGFLVIFLVMNKNLIKRLKYLNLSGKISKLFKVFNYRSKLIIVEFCVLKLRSYRFTRRRAKTAFEYDLSNLGWST